MKIKLLLTTILLLSLSAGAQNMLKIIEPGGTVDLNGTTVIASGASSDYVLELPLWVVNTSGGDLTEIQVTRQELFVTEGTKHTTCWFVCPPEDYVQNQSDGVVKINGNNLQVDIPDLDTNKTFSSKHYPENISGCELYRYIFKERTNPDDSSYVDIRFTHGTTNCFLSNDEFSLKSLKPEMNLYPNPSNGEITLDVVLPSGRDYTMKVVNVVGQNVIDQTTITTGIRTLDWTSLNPGMYFVILSDGEKAVMTKKIQITR